MNARALHRAIALLTLALLGFVVLEFVYLGPLRVELSRYAGNAEQLADLESRVIEVKAQLAALPAPAQASREASYTGGTPDQSLIALQETIQSVLTSSGGVPMTIQGSYTTGGPGLVRLTALVRASFSEPALLTFVREIESLPNGISVQKLDVMPPVPEQGGSSGLDVTITIGAIHRNAA